MFCTNMWLPFPRTLYQTFWLNHPLTYRLWIPFLGNVLSLTNEVPLSKIPNCYWLFDCQQKCPKSSENMKKGLSTFGAIVGGLGEQTLTVIRTFESPLDTSTESDVVLALRGRDG